MLDQVERVQVELFGSLALTGLGHATDRAVLLGLWLATSRRGSIRQLIESTVAAIRSSRSIKLAGTRSIPFDEARDLIFRRDQMFPPGARTRASKRSAVHGV